MKRSAGILLYRIKGAAEFFLVHPGGPYWKNKDAGVWSIPKGEYTDSEDPLNAAIREFEEETGQDITGNFIALTPIKQKNGKQVFAWAVEGDMDPASIKSNSFSMEWPPRSGKQVPFPEVDKAGWFTFEEAKQKILSGQELLLEEILRLINSPKN